MARYIALGKSTREGGLSLRDAAQRMGKAQQYFDKLGIKIVGFFATLGPYDYVSILEGPDDITTAFKAAAFSAGMGSVTWLTMPAIPFPEFAKLVQDVPAP